MKLDQFQINEAKDTWFTRLTKRYFCTECGGETDGDIEWADGSGFICTACAEKDEENE